MSPSSITMAMNDPDLHPPGTVRAELFDRHGANVIVEGELDLALAGLFSDTIEEQIGNGRRRLLIDLSATTFCDSSAMGAFLRAIEPLRADPAAAVVLVHPHEIVQRYLEVSGVGPMFSTFATRDEAIDALGGANARLLGSWRLVEH
jgi:stage II sporulation protein AA (anti-sigma F factor antagonist)